MRNHHHHILFVDTSCIRSEVKASSPSRFTTTNQFRKLISYFSDSNAHEDIKSGIVGWLYSVLICLLCRITRQLAHPSVHPSVCLSRTKTYKIQNWYKRSPGPSKWSAIFQMNRWKVKVSGRTFTAIWRHVYLRAADKVPAAQAPTAN